MIVRKRDVAELSKRGRTPFWIRGASQTPVAFEEKALSIFQPDTLIPVQYLATYQRRFHLDPERALMLAILEDAIVCFQDNLGSTGKRKRSLYHEAEEWILADDRFYLFSFENICETLGFEPAYIREGLMRWKQALQEQNELKETRRRWAS